MYESDALQDQFVDKILQKTNGFYLDIGSCGAKYSNNTFHFDMMGWKGICIEMESGYNSSYSIRSCHYVNANALEVDYLQLFQEVNAPHQIDYLSLDIDTASLEALKKIPHDQYRFSVITIEHDGYIYGDTYRSQQREILEGLGYKLIAPNVKVPHHQFIGLSGLNHLDNNGFEDWWIDLLVLPQASHLHFDNMFPEGIIGSL